MLISCQTVLYQLLHVNFESWLIISNCMKLSTIPLTHLCIILVVNDWQSSDDDVKCWLINHILSGFADSWREFVTQLLHGVEHGTVL